MEEFRKILTDAIEVLRKPTGSEVLPAFKVFNEVYNRALDDVITQVIKRIPN